MPTRGQFAKAMPHGFLEQPPSTPQDRHKNHTPVYQPLYRDTILRTTASRRANPFESSENELKIRGVHSDFPLFVRMAYGWLFIAAVLGVAATGWDTSGGISGASRHALTVGFISVMILSVGQRILPAFAGMRIALEYETDVCGIGICHSGLHAVCLVRSSRLPRVCSLGLVGFADFRAIGTGRTYRVRREYSRYIYSAAQTLAETDHARGCARQDFLKRTRNWDGNF